ncbi:MAG: DEAD/DEAH box helicase family protein [Thermoplasmata archaeon]
MDCIKCQMREAEYGSLCEQCYRGARGRDIWEDTEAPSFEEYRSKELDRVPLVVAIAKDDDELLLYEGYKESRMIFPNLKYPYKWEYAKLEEWFIDRFLDLLRRRTEALGSFINPDESASIRDLSSQFYDFRRSILEIIRHINVSTQNGGRYAGTACGSLLTLLLRKILRKSKGNHLLVDEVACNFVPGSALFFLELFAQMKNSRILVEFMNLVSRLSREEIWRTLHRPLVMPVLWNHQKIALDRWMMGGFHGIIEMATATGMTLIGLAAIEELARRREKLHVRVLAHSKAILNQWRREAIEKLGLPDDPNRDYTMSLRCDGVEIEFNTIQSVHPSPREYPTDLLFIMVQPFDFATL